MANQNFTINDGIHIRTTSAAPGATSQGDIVVDTISGDLVYNNGSASAHVATASNTLTLSNKSIDASTNTLTNIANAAIIAGAAIAYSKLNLTGSVVNADVSASAAIAYSKLNLATSILNSDISASASISFSKMSTLTATQALVTNASGVVTTAATLPSSLGGTGANLGASTGVLQAASGVITAGSVALTSQVSGVLPVANGGTNNGTLPVTAGGIIYTDGTKLQNAGAGTSGFVLTSGGAGAPTWTLNTPTFSGLTTEGAIYASSSSTLASTTAGTTGQVLTATTSAAPAFANTPGMYYASVYYPGSATNYWSNALNSYGDYTAVGTIPTPTTISNSNFGTISKATSNLPGINFSAPRTGTIRVTIYVVTNVNSATQYGNLKLIESTTSTLISYGNASSPSTAVLPVTFVGYFPATVSTTYNFKLQGYTNIGTMFISGASAVVDPNSSQLTFSMEYIN